MTICNTTLKNKNKKKLLIYGFSSKNEADIINELVARNNVEVVAFLNSRFSKEYLGNINHCKLKNYQSNKCPIELYNKIIPFFAEFFFCRVRPKQIYLQREKYYDYIDFFANYVNFFYDILSTRKVDVVFFANIPHLGPDYILYNLAQLMGIKTYFFYQTLFPNKFIYCDKIENIGVFEGKQSNNDDFYEIKNTFEKDLFYMHRGSSIFSKIKRKFRWISINRSIITLTYLLKFPFELAYKWRLKRAITHNIDFEKKFVYFALHLQPEATTNPMGNIYADQTLAIEHLRQKLPPDWYIYIKENPYQDEFRRGRLFFERIKKLPNTFIVPSETNTYHLLKKCQFAATITGTVGWETISGGKKALVFGDTWYDKLPGVFKFTKDFDVNHLLNYTFNHDSLQNEFNRLYNSFANGIIGQGYIKIYPKYNNDINKKMVAEFIEKLANT